MRKYIDPTIRDIKNICAARNIPIFSWRGLYNDKHKSGNTRRIKLGGRISWKQMELLEMELSARFPAHVFAVGNHPSWHGPYRRDSGIVRTVIYIKRNNELYDEFFPERREVVLTLDEIAKLAGCNVSDLKIVK
jgi:hypothetical protein